MLCYVCFGLYILFGFSQMSNDPCLFVFKNEVLIGSSMSMGLTNFCCMLIWLAPSFGNA